MCNKARQQAEKDIREELRSCSKAFIAFRVELNPIMRKLVKEYTKAQRNV